MFLIPQALSIALAAITPLFPVATLSTPSPAASPPQAISPPQAVSVQADPTVAALFGSSSLTSALIRKF